MSAAEDLNAQEEKLPENPVAQVLSVVSEPQIVQVVEDVSIAANEGTARLLESESANTGHDANNHIAQQLTNEAQASARSASAETALTDDGYHSNAGAAEKHDIQAQTHNVLAHSASIHSDEAGAKAAALEQVSKVQRAVQEESTRISFALEEIADRTLAGVEAEMKAMNVVEDSGDTGSIITTNDLEAELAMNAQANAPKMS